MARMSESTQNNGPAATIDRTKPADAPPPEPPADPRPFYRKPAFVIFIVIVGILAIGGGAYYVYDRQFEDTDDAFIDGHVIPINPQVSALVKAIHFDDNTPVHKGDLLVELDPTDFAVAVAQYRGAEAAAMGKLEQAKSSVPSAQSAVNESQAALDSAQVNFDNADRDLKRYQQMDDRAKSVQQLDNATATQKQARANVEQASARLESAKLQVLTAKASVTAAEGDLQKAHADTERAEVNLGYCKIYAPCDGKITNKNVDPGAYVTPTIQLFTLVSPDVWVISNFKETQLDRMQPGQSVRIKVDAYPDRDFFGKVDSIQSGTGSRFSIIPAENATGNFVKVVQRVPVKILFDSDANNDPKHPLAPGMSVEPRVRVQ
jgi:membrane fusion protein (multidrug efflux system)